MEEVMKALPESVAVVDNVETSCFLTCALHRKQHNENPVSLEISGREQS
jgi:hypothetical protein